VRAENLIHGSDQRTPQVIVAGLEAAGYLTRARAAPRVRYTANPASLLRHPSQDGHRTGPFLAFLATARKTPAPPAARPGCSPRAPAIWWLQPGS
jgi:hypothetical protein